MFNYGAIDKTPTINQIKAIIKYMEEDPKVTYFFSNMISMKRPEPNKLELNVNDAHSGNFYEVIFNDKDEIISFKSTGSWMS